MLAPGPVLDAHFHLWDPGQRRHRWLDSAPPALQRRFGVEDFTTAITGSEVSAAVLVQALADTAETEDLLDVAAANPLVAGVVGWVDLTSDDVWGSLDALRRHPGGHALVGLRHLVQDEPDPRWLERPEVVRGLRAVADAGLAYDLLVRPPQLPSALAAVDAVEGGRFVLDHGGKPPISPGTTEPWAGLVAQLAARPNVVCKFSGFVTEASPSWGPDDFAPYVDLLVAAFGPERLIFGSDWPVCTSAASYGEVVGLAWSLLHQRLGHEETSRVMMANAVAAYCLGPRLT